MLHSIETCELIGRHEALGLPIWRCPECGRKIMGERIAGACGGGKRIGGTPADRTACKYRREKIEAVPCGECAKTGRAKMIPVYLCTFGSGRACSLVDVGRAEVTCCAGCADRVAPMASESAE